MTRVTMWRHENNVDTVFVLVMPGNRFPGIEYIPDIAVTFSHFGVIWDSYLENLIQYSS